MRRRLELLLRRVWAGETDPGSLLASTLLRPLGALYGGAVSLRNAAYDRGWLATVSPPLPVISVGNLLVGGTGKTPVAAWVARLLADASRRPAVALRGYGEDEVRLHRRWNPDVPVHADPDRVRAAVEARQAGSRSLVLDDGFQHRRLGRRLDLVLLPVEGPWRVRLLPAGPYREPLSALERADHVVLTRRTGDREAARNAEERLRSRFPDLPVAHLRLAPDGWSEPGGGEAEPPRGPLLAVSGIARPEGFRMLTERLTGSAVELMGFPDHHDFIDEELASIRRAAGGRTVVTTEKDAARLPRGGRELGPDARILRLRVEEDTGADELRRAVLRATTLTGSVQESAGPGSASGAAEGSSEGRRP